MTVSNRLLLQPVAPGQVSVATRGQVELGASGGIGGEGGRGGGGAGGAGDEGGEGGCEGGEGGGGSEGGGERVVAGVAVCSVG